MTKAITVEELIGPPFYFQVDSRFIRWDKFKEMAAKQPTILDKVTAIKRGMSNKVLRLKLPITGDPNIALLVAKVMGDSHLSHDFRFTYYNSENTLIDEVISAVEKSIGKVDYYRWTERDSSNCFRVRFPSIIGYLLYFFGAPTGEKVRKEFGVPEWIKNGSPEIKAAFLRGLFDDECTVIYERKHYHRAIVLAMGKAKSIETTLQTFLQDIKALLAQFGIKSSDIFFQEQNKDVIILRFYISSKENIGAFHKHINSSHPAKRSRLALICSSYVDIHKNRNIILDVLSKSFESLTTAEVSKLTSINHDLVHSHLTQLYKEGKLVRLMETRPMRWSTKHNNERLENVSAGEPAIKATLEPLFQDVSQ